MNQAPTKTIKPVHKINQVPTKTIKPLHKINQAPKNFNKVSKVFSFQKSYLNPFDSFLLYL